MTADMQPHTPKTQASTSQRHRQRRQRVDPALLKDPAHLYIAAADAVVCVSDALNHPLISELLIEDLWWRACDAAWRADRPSWFRRAARRAWVGRGDLLDRKRDRIAQLAAELGIEPGHRRTSRRFLWRH